MPAPVIGIPQCLDERGRWRAGREYLYLDRAYARAVDDAGGLALHLPIQSDADALIDHIDALLLPGGDDFLPAHPYPGDVHFEPAAAVQVGFDQRLLTVALARGLPVLGICYGAQLMALHHGGSLHHHVPLDLPDAAPHDLDESEGRHLIRVEAGTRLAAALPEELRSVNSLHHQAIDDPGRGLFVSARSPDGVVEAIESRAAGFLLGVQWHPEKLAGEARLAVFRALVAACAG
jgi:putative glutamine amidotransferase